MLLKALEAAVLLSSVSKIVRSAYACKAALSRHHHIVIPAGTVDDKHIAAAVKSTDNADMGILRVENKIAGQRLTPGDFGAIAMLGAGPTAMPNDIAAACDVVKHPIHKAGTV